MSTEVSIQNLSGEKMAVDPRPEENSSYKMLIGGELIQAPSAFGVINPATGSVFAQVSDCSKELCDEAVKSAKTSFQTWQFSSYEERKAVVASIITKTKENKKKLMKVLTLEQGKPTSVAEFEVEGVCAFLGEISTATKVEDKVLIDNDDEKVIEMRVPLGVIAGICPWNYPLLLAALKVVEAIMTGNTIVVKSSPHTPLTTNLWGEVIADVIPAGVVNIISGGDDAGQWLVNNPGVNKVSFTGSVMTGKDVQAKAAQSLKHVTLELGGNDAAICLNDAIPSKVATGILDYAMLNSGQICVAVKRCYVPRGKYEEYIEAFKKAAAAQTVGNGLEKGVTMGPLCNQMQYERICELVEDAKKNGAKVEAGGNPLEGGGYFYPPTILSNVSGGMRIVDEEQFGPVLPIIPYDTEEDAIQMANNTPFGLGGSVWGEDSHAATTIAKRVDAGTVWVNSHSKFSPDIPFGGRKESGIGRQMGTATIEGHTDTKIVRCPKPKNPAQ